MGRFVFISSCTHAWGGSEELWAAAAARLAGDGHAVTILKTRVDPEHPRIGRLLSLGCQVRDLHQLCAPSWIRLPRPLVAVTARARVQRAAGPLMRRYFRGLNPDLVVVSQGVNFDGALYADLCRAGGLPYAMVSQKASDHVWPSDADRDLMRSAFQAARRCYFVSQHNLRLTECQIDATLVNAEIVRNPFLVSGAMLPWPCAQDQPTRLACVARLETGEKGQDILLRVLARPPWKHRKISVSLFGSGPNREALRGLARRLQVDTVEFAGFERDVESIWKTHHALVLASRTEGLPLALVEAMMCGRFGIITNEGGSAEVVEEGRTGFIASAATVDAFDAAMERAWQVRERWEAVGQAAHAAIKTMVPADPAAAFSPNLLGLAESRGR